MNFLTIFKLTIPVMMGYIPLGMAFGLLLSKLLIPWYYAFFMSAFIYAGSGQFLLLTLFASQATILEIGIATFLLNLPATAGHNLWRSHAPFYFIFRAQRAPPSPLNPLPPLNLLNPGRPRRPNKKAPSEESAFY